MEPTKVRYSHQISTHMHLFFKILKLTLMQQVLQQLTQLRSRLDGRYHRHHHQTPRLKTKLFYYPP